MVAVLLRLSGKLGVGRLQVIAVNYLTAVLLSMLIQGGGMGSSFEALGSVAGQVFAGGSPASAREEGILWGIVAGIPLGIIYFLAFLAYRKALRECGLGLSGGFAKMGILLPMVLSMLLWGEFPGKVQWAGIAVALAAVFIGAFRNPSGGTGRFSPVLLLVFLANGMAEFGSKVYQSFGGGGNRDFFLLWVFGVAFLCSGSGILKERGSKESAHVFNPMSALLGVPLGVANYFSSWFLIPALGELTPPLYSRCSVRERSHCFR